MAAPVFQRGELVGSLGLASRDLNREYSQRDRQVLIALAEHASLALNHARALDEVGHEAFHDSLTGLPNRALFLDRVAHALAARRPQRRAGRRPLHRPGRLQDVQRQPRATAPATRSSSRSRGRLAARLRPSDTIARLGGDEFAVLLDEVVDPRDAARGGRAACSIALSEPLTIAEREVFVSASIGIALGNADAETLLRDADLAMYRAKADGKGRYQAYEPRMHAEIVERLEFEVDLKRAIERRRARPRLPADLQPAGRARSPGSRRSCAGSHPTRGMVPPDALHPAGREQRPRSTTSAAGC